MQDENKTARRIAKERIDRLFELSFKRMQEDNKESKTLARRYTRMLKLISNHYKIKLDKQTKEKICKNCGNILIPGISCTIRISGKKKLYKCECGFKKKVYF